MKIQDMNDEKNQFMKLQCGCAVDNFEGTLLSECTDHIQANFMN